MAKIQYFHNTGFQMKYSFAMFFSEIFGAYFSEFKSFDGPQFFSFSLNFYLVKDNPSLEPLDLLLPFFKESLCVSKSFVPPPYPFSYDQHYC